MEYGNPTEKQLPWDMKEEEVFDSRSGETLELERETPLPHLVYKPSSAYHDVSL